MSIKTIKILAMTHERTMLANISYNSKDENEERAQAVDPSKKSSFKDRIMTKVSPGSSRELNEYSEPERISNNVTKIIISLFLLVGFIVLVTAIFVAVIGNDNGQQAQILGNVFVGSNCRWIYDSWNYHISSSRQMIT